MKFSAHSPVQHETSKEMKTNPLIGAGEGLTNLCSVLSASGRRAAAAILIIVALLWLSVIAPPEIEVFPMMQTQVEAGAATGGDIIQIPLRWCACEGSPAVTNPSGVGEPDTDNVLWRRHERASDRIWIPGASITFRSAVTAEIRDKASFPIIKDPKPPSAGGPGELGDVLSSTTDKQEVKDAVASCQAAWDALAKEFGVSLSGPVAINIRHFVNSDGSVSGVVGKAGFLLYDSATGDSCKDPTQAVSIEDAWVMVVDNSFRLASDPDDRTLGHELGHIMYLGHGNGLDDDGDMLFDRFCDFDESSNEPVCVMHPNIGIGSNAVTPLQKRTARAIGILHPGAKLDPPALLVDGPTISDQRVDTVHDIADDSVDIVSVRMTENTIAQQTSFTHQIFGTIPLNANNQYVVFADLDGNPATGGNPSALDFDTSFKGAELITRVQVSQSGGVRSAVPTVWRFQSGAFVQVTDSRIRAQVFTPLEAETGLPFFDFVSIQMPNAIRGPVGSQIRIQAIAQLPGATVPGPLDRLPDGPGDGSNPLFLVQPQFPVCNVTPAQVRPGAIATVEVSGLFPNRLAKVVIGDQLAATGLIDGSGNAAIQFPVPFDARLGLRLLTVGVMGTALTADCVVNVAGEPDVKCDTFCFRSPQYYLLNLNHLPRTSVVIAGMNFNAPVSTSNIQAMKLALQGGATPLQQFNQQFVAAQLSLALAGGEGSAPNVNVLWSPLHCSGLDFAPVMLSTGVTITRDFMVKDLFQQARSAITGNRQADLFLLGRLFTVLNGNSPLNQCRPPMPTGSRLVCTGTVGPNGGKICCGIEDSNRRISISLGCVICDARGACSSSPF